MWEKKFQFVKFDQYCDIWSNCDIWSKLWNLVKIVKHGQNWEMWSKIALTSRAGLLWPRHTAQLAFSGLEFDNRTKLFWTLNLTIGHSEIYMGCPLVPCSHVVADSGKILLEPSKTFCHNCSTMSCQSCPWGHEMGGNHSGKTCPSPDYAKGFTAQLTITVYTTAWKIMPAKGYKCDRRTIEGHHLCQKRHSTHMTGMARQLSQYWVLVKRWEKGIFFFLTSSCVVCCGIFWVRKAWFKAKKQKVRSLSTWVGEDLLILQMIPKLPKEGQGGPER